MVNIVNRAKESDLNGDDNHIDEEDVLSVATELNTKVVDSSNAIKPKKKAQMEVLLCSENGIPLLCKSFETFKPQGRGKEVRYIHLYT